MNNLENFLLIIDNSYEEIYNDKEFFKLATAGRHKNINVIHIKHNHYQQSKWSRTIDLNISHIILFKSACDIQQVEFFSKQLILVKFLKHCYQLAAKELFGHLLINLDPKTSDCLRYCSNITEPGLKQMANLESKQLKKYLRNSDRDVILVLCECLHNVLLGHVRVKVRDLEKHRHIFESVLKK